MKIKALIISDYRETASVRPEAEFIIGLKKAGIDVEIMTYGNAAYVTKFRQARIIVYEFHPQKKFDKKEITYIREILQKGGHHILHLFNSKAIINGIKAAKNLPVKVVLYRGYTGNIHWYDPAAYFKYLHPRVDKITCLAQSVKDHIDCNLFFDKNKSIVIHKGHSPDWYKNIQPVDLQDFNIPKNAFVAVCVANARPMKGIGYLLKSTYFLPKELPIYLILVGNNMGAGKNKSIIQNSPNSDKIILPGYRTDALNIVAASDVFVLASLKGEAITKAVIEAMSLGVAPIVTDIPGNKELVIHEECGLVVPTKKPAKIAEAILKLYHDRALCNHYGQAAKKQIETYFHIDKTVRELKSLYEVLATG